MPALTDVQWIFVVLVVLYAFEMLVWVRPAAIPFVTRWGTFARRRPPLRLTGNQRGDLIVGGPLPWDMTWLVHQCPISIGQTGVAGTVLNCPASTDRLPLRDEWFSWAELQRIRRDERQVWCGQRMLAETATATAAKSLTAQLSAMARLDEGERVAAINAFHARRFDQAAIDHAKQQITAATWQVRWGATLLAVWMFVFGGLMYADLLPIPVDASVIWAYLGILFLIWFVTNFFIWRAHRYLHPDRRMERVQLLATSFLSPAVPLRSIDFMGRDLIGDRHPVTVSASVDDRAVFEQLAEHAIRDLAHPLPLGEISLSAKTQQVLQQHSAGERQQLETLIKRCGMSPDEMREPPVPEDDDSRSYCPRCHQQFELADASCDNCHGLPTRALRDCP